jgi:hypothetical protein
MPSSARAGGLVSVPDGVVVGPPVGVAVEVGAAVPVAVLGAVGDVAGSDVGALGDVVLLGAATVTVAPAPG